MPSLCPRVVFSSLQGLVDVFKKTGDYAALADAYGHLRDLAGVEKYVRSDTRRRTTPASSHHLYPCRCNCQRQQVVRAVHQAGIRTSQGRALQRRSTRVV